MSVNLSNINISLDQFNAQARGDYNIGQMKLSEDGTSIYRANKHKTLTFLNTTKISQEEALAVKDAFCRALSNRGLSPDDLAAVKNKLGIGDDKFYRLKTGQITPLTAAEVREIIDQYAASLNASGATKLETSADIYKGVSKETLEKRAEKRGEVNYDTVSSMMSAADTTVNKLMDVLDDGKYGDSFGIGTRGTALEIKERLSHTLALASTGAKLHLETCNMDLECNSDGIIVAHIKLEGGNILTISTETDKEGLLKKVSDFLDRADGKMPVVEEAGVEKTENQKAEEEKKIAKDAMDKVTEAIKDITDEDYVNSLIDGKLRVATEKDLKPFLKRGVPLDAAKDAYKVSVRSSVRDAIMTPAVEALSKALTKIRGLDSRNAELVNKFRNVGYGEKVKVKELLDEISEALEPRHKSSVSKPQDIVVKDNVGNPGSINDVDDNDGDNGIETLNINKLLGNV